MKKEELIMASPAVAPQNQTWQAAHEVKNEAHSSGVSWSAVGAGSFVAAALSLTLLALFTGMGFSAISPWASTGASASTVGKGAIFCFILVQIIACSMGGYLAGRLRARWVHTHTHEVYFRDTAHGFLVWAVSVVVTAAFLASAATSMMGRGVGAVETDGAPRSARAAGSLNPSQYFVDTLLRSNPPRSEDTALRDEVGLIFANGLRQGGIPPADQTYLAHVVAAKTGVGEPEAERRVSDVFAQAQQNADNARKSVAHSLYWAFLALLIGAFCAGYAATIGGQQRDRAAVI
jgi:hypothetical protein